MAKNDDVSIDIGELIPDPKNARRHSSKNIGAIESSIRAFGPARSIVIDKNGVVRAGNGTLEAAKRAGVKTVRVVHSTGDELVAVVRDDLSDVQAAAYALADNRASDLSEWDPEALQRAVDELTEEGVVLEDFGFDEHMPIFAPVMPWTNDELPPPDVEKAEKTKTKYRDDGKREKENFRRATDTEYWCCFCFQTREQKEEFLSNSGLAAVIDADKYLDGQAAADVLKIKLTKDLRKWPNAQFFKSDELEFIRDIER